MAIKLIRITGKGGEEFFIEVNEERIAPEAQEESISGPYAAAVAIPRIKDFSQITTFIKNRLEEISEQIGQVSEGLAPDKVAITFSIGLEGKARLPVLLEGGGNASITVCCEWSLPKSKP